MTDPLPCEPAACKTTVDVTVDIQAGGWTGATAMPALQAERAARRALEAAWRSTRPAELGVILSDDATVRVLNRDYRGKDKATNVLSFPLADEGDFTGGDAVYDAGPMALDTVVPILLGDVVLAFETVEAEVRDQHKSFSDHLAHLVIHGVLHLLGFDHETDAEAETMERLEARILAGLGIADPYGDRSGRTDEGDRSLDPSTT